MDFKIGVLAVLLAQAVPGSGDIAEYAKFGIAGVVIWVLLKQNVAKEARLDAADATKEKLLREIMGGVSEKFEAGFEKIAGVMETNGREIRELKQWILDEIQDARKLRDSDPPGATPSPETLTPGHSPRGRGETPSPRRKRDDV